jgi:hypothetical protein
MNERRVYRLDPAVRLRFERAINGGACYVFHNRRQCIRECGPAEYRMLRLLRREALGAAELAARAGETAEDAAAFLQELEAENMVERVLPDPGSDRPGAGRAPAMEADGVPSETFAGGSHEEASEGRQD